VVINDTNIVLGSGRSGVIYVPPTASESPGHSTINVGSTSGGCGAGDTLTLTSSDTYTTRVFENCGGPPPPGYKYPFTVTDDTTGAVQYG